VLAIAIGGAAFEVSSQTPPTARPQQPPRPAGGDPFRPGAADKPSVDPAKADLGKKTFIAHCGFCHGSDGAGGEGGSDLIRSVVVAHDRHGEEIAKVVLPGRPEKGMPPIKLTETQIEEIAHYLHQRVAEKASRRARPIDVVVGDAKAGQAYFNGAGKCNTCHSPIADLAGIASKFDALDLQQRFIVPRGRGGRGGGQPERNPTQVTVTPGSGPAVSGTLVRIDDFDVALRDAAGEYRSWKRTASLKVELRDPYAAHVELLDQYTDTDIHNLLSYLVTLK
jgi:mono/diheme cytochrome c family protein